MVTLLGPPCQLWEHFLRLQTMRPGYAEHWEHCSGMREHEISVLLNTKKERYIIDFLGGVVQI